MHTDRIWRHLCFRMPFSWISTECVEQVTNVEKKSWKVSLRKTGSRCHVLRSACFPTLDVISWEGKAKKKTQLQNINTWKPGRFDSCRDLTSISIVNVHGPSHRYISSRKPFYNLLPEGNKQTSFMPMEASAFVNAKPRTCGQLFLHCDYRRPSCRPRK